MAPTEMVKVLVTCGLGGGEDTTQFH